MSELSDALGESFAAETDADTATEAAEKVAEFVADYDEELTDDDLLALYDEAPYDGFEHAHDWVVGELAAGNDDCTDSRPYRLAGFGELAADPEQGA